MSDFDLAARTYMGEKYLDKKPVCPACEHETIMIGFIPPFLYKVYCPNANCSRHLDTMHLPPRQEPRA